MTNDIQTKLSRVAIMQAVANRLKDAIEDERTELDAIGREDYETKGGRGFDIIINGAQVGSFYPVKTRGTKSRIDKHLEVTDYDAFEQWVKDNPEIVARYLRTNPKIADGLAGAALIFGGEVAAGCDWVEVVVPGEPAGRLKYMALKVDADKVEDAVQGQLVQMAVKALEAADADRG